MLIAYITMALGVAPLASSSPAARSFVPVHASAPEECAILQAAYAAAIGKNGFFYPVDVRSSPRRLEDLTTFRLDYRAQMAMSAQEFDELAAHQGSHDVSDFRPDCHWTGTPGPSKDDEGHPIFITFTRPLFSQDRHLALAEVSFREQGRFAYGVLCTVRLTQGTWSAQCLRSWIV
jgi:hypothetical protein